LQFYLSLQVYCQKPDASIEFKPIADKYIEVMNTGNLYYLDEIKDKQIIDHTTLIYESDISTNGSNRNGKKLNLQCFNPSILMKKR